MLDSGAAGPYLGFPFRPPMKSAAAFFRRACLLAAVFLTASADAADPLTRLSPCTFVPTEWADGDSFQIKSPDGSPLTLRLYGADCIEWHVNDKTDATRLAAQRRYFGLAGFGGSPQTSMDAAKATGRAAAEETARLLARPFTVHTAYADARGDANYKRIYAFVTTADGADLAEHLVRAGLARAFGVYRENPAGMPGKGYQELLRDAELVAAKAGSGVWAKTDWASLPAERQQQRMEDAELEMAAGPAKASVAFKLNPNTAARDELMKVPGIGEITANRIIEGRPYQSLAGLEKVEGLGPRTLAKLMPFFQIP